MESNTKKYVSKYDAKKLFEESGVGAAEIVKECETGEFNTVYSVRSNGKRYYLKFGSDDSTPTLNYEKDMLRAELAAYAALEGTDVLRPTIVFADTSREKINVDYFITEGLDAPLQGLTFPNLKARKRVMYQLGADVAKIHAVKGTEFGYFQFGKKPTWAEAYKLMIDKIVADATVLNVRIDTFRVYAVLDRVKDILAEVTESSLVHGDLWAGNVFVNRKNFTYQGLIDWERAFWGDIATDFATLALCGNIERNRYFVKGYNSVTPIEFNAKLHTRIDLMKLYYGMVMLTEPELRWKKGSFQYNIHKYYGRKVFNKALKALEKPL